MTRRGVEGVSEAVDEGVLAIAFVIDAGIIEAVVIAVVVEAVVNRRIRRRRKRIDRSFQGGFHL